MSTRLLHRLLPSDRRRLGRASRFLPPWLALGFCLALSAGHAAENSPARAGLSLGAYSGKRLTFLAIDDYALPLRGELCYYLSKPTVRAEPVITPSPDSSPCT